MNKIWTAAIALLFSLALLRAQECSTAWPYLYPAFTDGTVTLGDGTQIQRPLNVHTLAGALHYIENGIIKEAAGERCLSAVIGADRFLDVNGRMMKVVVQAGDTCVVRLSLGDFERLLSPKGAYGSSSVSSATRSLTSLEIAGRPNQNHMELWERRHGGERVPLVDSYYLVLPGYVFEASRRGLESALDPAQRTAFRQWLRTHKIRWNDPESLLSLKGFFAAFL